jgi:hypothetical protein
VEKIFPSKSHLFFILFFKIGMHRSTENFRKVSKGFLGLKPLESSLEGNFIMREGESQPPDHTSSVPYHEIRGTDRQGLTETC